MNQLDNLSPDRRSEVLQERIALRVAGALNELQRITPRHEIDERLRFARERALERVRAQRRLQSSPAVLTAGGGAAALGSPVAGGGTPWWLRLSSLLPPVVLLAGLFLIDHHYTQTKIEAAAEIDAALLADDLPPEAYRDPGFAEFLKTERP
jgi:hypothetical protein